MLGTIVNWYAHITPQRNLYPLGGYLPSTMGAQWALHRSLTHSLKQPKLVKLRQKVGFALTSVAVDSESDFHVAIRNDISVYVSGLTLVQTSKSGATIPAGMFSQTVKAWRFYKECSLPADITIAIESKLRDSLAIRMGTRTYLVPSGCQPIMDTLDHLAGARAVRLSRYTLEDTEQNKSEALMSVVAGLIEEANKISDDLMGKTSKRAEHSRAERTARLEDRLTQYEKLFTVSLTEVSDAISKVREGIALDTMISGFDEVEDLFGDMF